MAFNSARSYAHHIYTLEEAIQYRELHEAGLIDREIPASVLDEEYPNTSDDEETETWADVVEELRQQERQRRFEEMNAPHPALEREVPLDPASLVEEEDAGYFCA
uniref:Uncharacterized protein n=1 Tax=Heliothis virescens TaxID=7102 RepID=A0A2A4JBG5_HELVI